MSAFKQTFTQKQLQTLSLSYRMKLSLNLLQLNTLQLKEFLEKELLENPMFEVDMPMNFHTIQNNETWDIPDQKSSLQDELLMQINHKHLNLIVLEGILQNCDRNGYLRVSKADLAKSYHVSEQEVQDCLDRIHRCVPYGIAARNLSECLMLQLIHRYPDNELALKLVQEHLEDIAKNHLEKLANLYHKSKQQIKDAIYLIQSLNPRPGSTYDFENIIFVKPDIQLENIDGEIKIIMPNYFNVKENEYYKGISLNKEEKAFIKEKHSQGKAIIECLQHRKETLHAIMQVMVKTQQQYLHHQGPLRYLRMVDIGESLSVHETTISRAMKDKYYEYEGHVMPLKNLLCKQLHSTSVDHIFDIIKELIANENSLEPLSDQKLTDILKKQDIMCSRRTIAKYRSDLRIPSAMSRKRLKENNHDETEITIKRSFRKV